MKFNVSIIGGGLAGLISAIRLAQLNVNCILIDLGLPQANGQTGGFAKFSGAKFSLPPAGMGLLHTVENEVKLWEAIDSVSHLLGIDFSSALSSSDQSDDLHEFRSYTSLVLMPDEIDSIISRLTKQVDDLGVPIIKALCTDIETNDDGVVLSLDSNIGLQTVYSETLFYAGGRLGDSTLNALGLKPTNRKGLDVGARIEFSDVDGVSGLRSRGPDAKVIRGQCRTFCLNVPGKIFRYPFGGFSIPGGVVASANDVKANFGMLNRTPDKVKVLERIINVGNNVPIEVLEAPHFAKDEIFGDAEPLLQELYGVCITSQLLSFGGFLSDNGLVDWNAEHYIHLPLIDWHWNTYSLEKTFKTSHDNIVCVGDSSGHARGLLQAAVSGWLAAEEHSLET